MAALPAKAAPYDRLYTNDEFMALSLDPSKRYELVRGVIKEMSHPGGEHMLVSDNLYGELRHYVRSKGLGRVLPPGSFALNIASNPSRGTIRSPDLVFVPQNRVGEIGTGAITFSPDLAIEIYSPNDRPAELREKLEDYQAAGWDLVWVVYPPKSAPKYKAGTVEIYRLKQSQHPVKVLGLGEELDGEDVIPGFKMSVANLFEQ